VSFEPARQIADSRVATPKEWLSPFQGFEKAEDNWVRSAKAILVCSTTSGVYHDILLIISSSERSIFRFEFAAARFAAGGSRTGRFAQVC
jgi:hypothetical protein